MLSVIRFGELPGTGAGLGRGWKAADKVKVETNTLYLGPRRDVNRKVLAIAPKTPDWKAKGHPSCFKQRLSDRPELLGMFVPAHF